ncbi:MAG: hypothetical protein IKR59_07995, partial [Lachnospiraceae bacterium]|nr:hypothetical protein [Lachnospiraceae bacterium]
SESAALPFGYSATGLFFDSKRIIYEFPEKIKHFFQKVGENRPLARGSFASAVIPCAYRNGWGIEKNTRI